MASESVRIPVMSHVASERAVTAHRPLIRLSGRKTKLARILPGPFAVLESPDGSDAEKLSGFGLKAFRFMANGHAVEQLARGYYADKYFHVPLTVWAFTEAAAKAEAVRQIHLICPATSWAVLPA